MLRNVDLTTSGKFRCEVSGEAPLFQTATHTNVLIVVGKLQTLIPKNHHHTLCGVHCPRFWGGLDITKLYLGADRKCVLRRRRKYLILDNDRQSCMLKNEARSFPVSRLMAEPATVDRFRLSKLSWEIFTILCHPPQFYCLNRHEMSWPFRVVIYFSQGTYWLTSFWV